MKATPHSHRALTVRCILCDRMSDLWRCHVAEFWNFVFGHSLLSKYRLEVGEGPPNPVLFTHDRLAMMELGNFQANRALLCRLTSLWELGIKVVSFSINLFLMLSCWAVPVCNWNISMNLVFELRSTPKSWYIFNPNFVVNQHQRSPVWSIELLGSN